jgi:hypothetical protein
MKIKKLFLASVTVLMLLTTTMHVYAQTNLDAEVPGDNFSLEGALELFKKSRSPEEFEQMLNNADARVNNLDLNADGQIDYLRVVNRQDRNVHIFIIQSVISDDDFQDVAVIELKKLADGEAVLQITGDADVYGIETIIEPTEEVRINAGTTTTRSVVNVWTWSTVQFVYAPAYVVYASPWRWSYYPMWWRPWRPVAYHVYDPWWRPYRPHYAVCYTHRIGYLPVLYRPYRRTSVVVHHHYHHQVDRYRSRYASGARSDRYSSERYATNPRSRDDARGRDRNADQDRGYRDNRDRSGSRSSFMRQDVNRNQSDKNRTTAIREPRQGNVREIRKYEQAERNNQETSQPSESRRADDRFQVNNSNENRSQATFERKNRESNQQKRSSENLQSSLERSPDKSRQSRNQSFESRQRGSLQNGGTVRESRGSQRSETGSRNSSRSGRKRD